MNGCKITGIDMTEDDVLNKVEYKMLLAYNEIMKIQNKYDVTMRIASYIYSVLRLFKILKTKDQEFSFKKWPFILKS